MHDGPIQGSRWDTQGTKPGGIAEAFTRVAGLGRDAVSTLPVTKKAAGTTIGWGKLDVALRPPAGDAVAGVSSTRAGRHVWR